MSCWEINSKILREKYPGLLDVILNDEDSSASENLKIETAAAGLPTLSVNGLYVHSPRDPVREGQRLAQSIAGAGDSSAPVIVLGFGLGYAAQAIAENESESQKPIIIVEKNLHILRLAFEQRDLSSLLRRNNVAFVPGGSGEGIIKALSVFEKNNGEKSPPQIIRNRTLVSIGEQWYGTLENRIRAWTMRDDVNMATLKRFGRRWVRNLSCNMSAIRDLPGISRLAGLAAQEEAAPQGKPLPVFLAAGGPSLDGIAALLPEIQKRCIVVAVDTSLRFMQRNGVHPDFALVVDPQFWNSRHLDRCTGSHTRLVIESAAYPPVLRLPYKGMYLCGSLFPLGKFIEERVDPKGELGAGGSVATSAWDFARILGTQEIWIAGLDLAYPGLKTHFRGARFEEKALSQSQRTNPAETWLLHALREGGPFSAPSMSGGQVLTDHRLSFYAAWFENSFRQFPGIRNYSLSPDGLAISGLEPAAAEAILELPPRRGETDARLEAAFSRIENDFFEQEEIRRRAERYDNAVAALRGGLEKITAACRKGEAIAARALRNPGAADKKTLAALDEINSFITGSEVKDISGFLFPAEAITATGGGSDGGLCSYLESSVKLYRSLAEAAQISI